MVVAGWLVGFLAAWIVPRGETAATTDGAAETSDSLRLAGLEPSVALSPEDGALFEGALETVARLAKTNPDDPHVAAAAAIVHRLAHDAAGEAACWEKCLELDAANRQALVRSGKIALHGGEPAKAERLMRDALARDSGVEEYRILLASAEKDLGKTEESLRVLDEAPPVPPRSPAPVSATGAAPSPNGKIRRSEKRLRDCRLAASHLRRGVRRTGRRI